jgi:hypothetical protein
MSVCVVDSQARFMLLCEILRRTMLDIVFIGITVAIFLIGVIYVRLCEKL